MTEIQENVGLLKGSKKCRSLLNPHQESIDNLKKKLTNAKLQEENLREGFISNRDWETLLDCLQFVDRYLHKTRLYNYWWYYVDDFKGYFSDQEEPVSLEGVLRLECVGQNPLEHLLNKTRKNLEKKNPWDTKALDVKIRQTQERLSNYEKRKIFRSEAGLDQLTIELQQLQRKKRLLIESEQDERQKLKDSRDSLRAYVNQWKKTKQARRRIFELETQIKREAPYADFYELAYAKAAVLDKKTRALADQKKSIIEKTSSCPYCAEPLGDNPHLDHIQPVNRGGLSTKDNLIWCCANCNLTKSDKGLVEFLSSTKLDIGLTCDRLLKMGKKV